MLASVGAAPASRAQGGAAPAAPQAPPDPARSLIFSHLTGAQGLLSERVSALAQDRQGFLWIGTWNGLFRYDGHLLRRYSHDPANPHSLGGNIISALHVDRGGDLWVGVTEGGINRLDPVSEQFTRYTADPAHPETPITGRISAIAEDAGGAIWAATQLQGLYRIDPPTGQMRAYRHDPGDPTSISSDSALSLLIDGAGSVWVGTERGLDRLEPETGQFTHFLSSPDDPQNLLGHLILSLAEDDAGDLWLAVYDVGLHRFTPRTGQLTRYRHDPGDPGSIGDDNVYTVYHDRAGTLWVGTNAGGLSRFDPGTGRFFTNRHSPFDPSSLLDGAVRAIYEDRSGSLWLGIDGGGVSVWHRPTAAFRHYIAHPAPDLPPDSISASSVRAIYEDRGGTIWIGTGTDGLNRLDPATGTFTFYRHDPKDPRSLTGDSLYAIAEDDAGALWVGTFNGLNRLDPSTGEVTRFQHDPADPVSLSHNFVYALAVDHRGALWVGTDFGLNRYDPATGRFSVYRHDPEDANSLSNDAVLSLYPDADGALWVGTVAGGLNRFDPERGAWTRYRHVPTDLSSISSDTVNGIYRDRAGVLWVATNAGLSRLDSAGGQFTRYPRQSGVPADVVVGILEDDQGYLWLSTFSGLVRFDPRAETFKRYDRRDGLSNSAYDFFAYCRTSSGELWFGGKKGIDIVDPRLIAENPHAPPVRITGLAINNQPVAVGGGSVLAQSITTADALTLSHQDRVISFEFAALNFIAPEKNQYRYRLEGFDSDWLFTGSDRPFATYTNLDPGNYVFRVLAANNDGLWNETGASIRLTIAPAWWQTWWFYGLWALGALAVFGFVYRTKAHQLKVVQAAAAAVRESEQKYRVLFEAFPLGITVSDREGHIMETNAVAEQILGVPKPEHEHREIDAPVWRIIRPDGSPMPADEYASVIALRENRRVENVEMGIVKGEQAVTWISVTAAPIPLEPFGVVISYGDITERKRAVEALARSADRLIALHTIDRAILKSQSVTAIADTTLVWLRKFICCEYAGVLITAGDQSVGMLIAESAAEEPAATCPRIPLGSCSAQPCRALGEPWLVEGARLERYIADWPQLEGMGCLLVVPLIEGKAVLGALCLAAARPGFFTEEHIAIAREVGDTLAIAIHSARLLEREQQARRVAEQLHARLQEEQALLTLRIDERTAELRVLNAELERAVKLKDEFLASMSHELRTPLTAILGRSELLLEGIYGPTNEQQRGALQGVAESGQHLLQMINDILDLSKIKASRLALEPEDVVVADVCEASLRMVAQLAELKQISVHEDLESSVTLIRADPRRLKQILINLLSNAVKFTPSGGAIGLEVRGDAERQAVRFTVWDTGIGIAEEHFALLFQPFVQIDSHLSRQSSGTGLGLSLVHLLAEAHGGGVSVESTPGAGSRFSVTLPWARAAQPPTARRVAAPGEPAPADGSEARPDSLAEQPGPLILVAEDQPANVSMIEEILQHAGYRVVVARDGIEAVALAERERPAVILMDIQMPGIDGLEATRRIRAAPALRSIPIIALTALAMLGDRERCLAAGVSAYLSKPVGMRALLDTIEAQLRGG